MRKFVVGIAAVAVVAGAAYLEVAAAAVECKACCCHTSEIVLEVVLAVVAVKAFVAVAAAVAVKAEAAAEGPSKLDCCCASDTESNGRNC